VVGHDWGGALAWYAAMWHPERISRLAVLNCPHPSRMARALRTARQWRRSFYMLVFQAPLLPEAVLRAGNFAALRWLFRNDPRRPGAYSDADVKEIVAAAAQPGALTAMIDWYRAMVRRKPHKKWQPIDKPALVVWGEKDRFLLPELAEPDRSWVRDLRVVRLPDASHWVQADAPEEVNAALLPFLRG
jgi:pimeloyl-ACP methyl ester carboxylesterase